MFLFLFLGISTFHFHPTIAQAPVPPLQWINLTPYLTGSGPPPLKDASIGWDATSSRLLIFGGESAANIVTQETYLLSGRTLQWSAPNPTVPTTNPPARSAAIGGLDSAASYRADYVIWGGKGNSGPLSDLWSFDWQYEFWNQATITPSPPGPGPLWGASGGVISTSQLNNTLFITGGMNDTHAFDFQDVWGLDISGTLAPNVQAVVGSWRHLSTSTAPAAAGAGKAGQAGTMLSSSHIVTYGGCNYSAGLSGNASCATQDSHILTIGGDFASAQWVSESACPAPRYGAAMAPNLATSATSFASQAFLLLGSFNQASWNDQGGTLHGEVAILDTTGGTWTRVLPAGDPTSNPSYPSPREGATVLSLPNSINFSPGSWDTIVFGGREASTGKFVNEMWALRAYNGVITSTNQTNWAGYGNGVLQGGPNATGTGVTIQYLTQCASATSPSATGGGGGDGGSHPPQGGTTQGFDVSTMHKILSPLSVALLLPALLLLRYSNPSAGSQGYPTTSAPLLYVSSFGIFAAYAVGVAGFAISLTTARATTSLAKRSGVQSGIMFKTLHGKAGLALFAGLYAVMPIYLIACWLTRPPAVQLPPSPPNPPSVLGERGESSDTAGPLPDKAPMRTSQEGFFGFARRRETVISSAQSAESEDIHMSTSTHARRPSSLSDFFRGNWRRSTRQSCDGRLEKPSDPQRAFEVVNRPKRANVADTQTRRSMYEFQTALRDVSWMERRRDLHATSELDYAMSHMSPTPTPGLDTSSPNPLIPLHDSSASNRMVPTSPGALQGIFHLIIHAFIIFACVFCLVTLFNSGPLVAFIVFLIWTVAFYISLFLMAWYHIPSVSYLSLFVVRLRGEDQMPPPAESSLPRPSPTPLSQANFGPYTYHQPPYRRVEPLSDSERASRFSRQPRSAMSDEEDEDDDDRQHEMEMEMARRDVSVITVPKRRLVIANE